MGDIDHVWIYNIPHALGGLLQAAKIEKTDTCILGTYLYGRQAVIDVYEEIQQTLAHKPQSTLEDSEGRCICGLIYAKP
jgi:hypothetical protein